MKLVKEFGKRRPIYRYTKFFLASTPPPSAPGIVSTGHRAIPRSHKITELNVQVDTTTKDDPEGSLIWLL